MNWQEEHRTIWKEPSWCRGSSLDFSQMGQLTSSISKSMSNSYTDRQKKVVIARSEATWQSNEIASLRPEHHAVQGFVRNDILCVPTYLS